MRPSRPCFRSGFARARRERLERQRYQSSRVGRHGAFCGRLCHCFASRALALSESLPMIGKLLGHRKVQTTARYAHLAQHSVKAAAGRFEDSLAVDLDSRPSVSAAM